MAKTHCYHCMKPTTASVCPHCGKEDTVNNDIHQLPAGTVLQERYLVGRVLGQGGFGITYIGCDLESDTAVAVKEFFPASTVNRDVERSLSVRVNTEDMQPQYLTSRERFLREAEALQRLEDVPEIVDILGCFEENNTAYIVMEYIRGSELRHFVNLQGGKLTVDQTLKILEGVILALDRVHKKDLVHRDISPDNIMLHPLGGAKLLDFGAVRNVNNPDAEQDLTHSTEAILKHGFAPLEQYWSRGSLGPWTDIYAMGATIYYCLTGQIPPNAPARSMEEEDLNWDLAPQLSASQRAALEKAMALRAPDRYSSMEDFHKALYLGEEPAAKAEKTEPKPARKKKSKLLPVAAALVLVCGAAAAAFFLADREEAPVQISQEPTVDVIPETQSPVPETVQTEPVATEASTEPATEQTEPVESTTGAVMVESQPWEKNVMMRRPWGKLDLQEDRIQSISFYSSLENAPDNAVDISQEQDGSVLMWRDMYDVYVGSDGGINAVNCCSGLFSDLPELTTVNFGTAFHTDQATTMSGMFWRSCKLVSVDVQNLNTSNVTNMSNMFRMEHKDTYTYYEPGQVKGGNLDRLDVSEWDTSKVTDMSAMFYGCENIRSIDVSNWDTRSVTDMSEMFYGCTALQSPDVQFWNVGKVKDMSYMFYNCSSLNELWVDDWNTVSVNRVECMFYNCYNLRRLNMSDWTTGMINSTSYMFAYSGLESVGVANWDTDSIRTTTGMFQSCTSLKDLDVSNWDTSSFINTSYMFSHCESLVKLDVENWHMGMLSDGSYMFSECENLKTLDVSQWSVKRLQDAEYMFYNCLKLEDLDITQWDLSNIRRYTRFLNDGTYVQGQFWTNYFPKS